ncbi:EamA/RhaT family transporter [bacterium (Candidatus Blackallbacteria) CG17_big_fil_post_rev_8_21_14_2_50_48_46]|uniref:EamA/RhaT family transporter n=1 Tax=bacterium (Candidatus Blackallbacteria) CG17_big_fil_post_rev_8_21_14_2_50_48_46 TaxID=2014261 RepID=A0A2M7FZB9_9BACT|nr:MAG: EamA family transporter [bacterium (Candidatus Blackallbacteria) CG18_big_fil_WC_8_21_14_2_50_49_26]PIW14180.1 MAG: EamA/RhaT family transporter [bacterium (Candidatus Blackallbacteria) CG17_big_fil_post_rev_8_21_14_2_50_48_46]PIW46721.1 MAG: EamA/RhaT family transporter [bacterium (Candidatus Blackallbacteria) CG13_big_fil_rev_8_21_14_2_50_49_14]
MHFLLAGAFIISFAPVLVRLVDLPSAVIGFYRMLFGLFVLILIGFFRRQNCKVDSKTFKLALGAGLFFALDILFWQRSIHLIGPGLATLLANCQIFFVTLIGWAVLKEKPHPRLWIAIPTAILGLWLVVGPSWNSLSDGPAGILLGGLAAISYSLYLLVLRAAEKNHRKTNPEGPSPVMLWNTFSSLLILFMTVQMEKSSIALASGNLWLILIAYGIFIQGLAWLFISKGLAQVPASRGSLILLLQPALALVWDVLFFHHPLSAREASGALLTLIAIYYGASLKT